MTTNNNFTPVTGSLGENAFRNQNPSFNPDPCVQFGPEGTYLPITYNQYREELENFQIREDDVWICSFPKTGTTWVAEMTWLLGHDLDYKTASQESLFTRVRYLEVLALLPEPMRPGLEFSTALKELDAMPSPRYLKSHLPWNMLPKQLATGEIKPKIIYIARNPKDVSVSYYHHQVLLRGYIGSFDDFIQEFVGDLVLYGPYWTHVREFYETRQQPNILFLKYEDMKKDLCSVLQKTAAFLEKPALTQNQLENLTTHLSFNNMKSNPSVNVEKFVAVRSQVLNMTPKTSFIRKGVIGAWKEELSQDSITAFDSWIAEARENKLNESIVKIWDEYL